MNSTKLYGSHVDFNLQNNILKNKLKSVLSTLFKVEKELSYENTVDWSSIELNPVKNVV